MFSSWTINLAALYVVAIATRVVVAPIPASESYGISTWVVPRETVSPKAVLATPTILSLTLIETLETSYKFHSFLIGTYVKSQPVFVGE